MQQWVINDPDRKFTRTGFPAGMELPKDFFKHLELNVGDEHLTGIKIAQDLSGPSDFVFFHGAEGGNYSRVMSFAKAVVEQGSSIVAFDHSGHGDSTGTLKQSSLEKRVAEARAIIDTFADKNPKTISGSSMGGCTAVKLLANYQPKNLILYCPALYDAAAYAVRFDLGFTDIIRKPESWKNTDGAALLEKFTGKLLVIIGGEDKVIPKGVVALIDESARSASRKEILVVPGAPHAIHQWLVEHPEEAKKVAGKVAEFSR